MKDKERYKLIEDFANDLSVSKGGNVKISVCSGGIAFNPKVLISMSMKYEDCLFIDKQIEGAQSFLFYLDRNGYKIIKGKKK